MWIKKIDGSYLNTVSNTALSVYATGGAFAISVNNTGQPVANNFATAADAQNALDEFMSEQGFESIISPA